MKAGVGLVLEEAAAEAQDVDKLWPIADGGLGGGKQAVELKAEGNLFILDFFIDFASWVFTFYSS